MREKYLQRPPSQPQSRGPAKNPSPPATVQSPATTQSVLVVPLTRMRLITLNMFPYSKTAILRTEGFRKSLKIFGKLDHLVEPVGTFIFSSEVICFPITMTWHTVSQAAASAPIR